MKKIVCFVMAVILCLPLMIMFPAYAEWELPVNDEIFSIRNGISFGMSMEEVASLERSKENIPDTEIFPEPNYNRLGYSNISFLGNKAYLVYYFTKNKQLSSFAYLGLNKSHTFENMYEALAGKYGEPMLTTELSLFNTAIWHYAPFCMFLPNGDWSADTLSVNAAASSLDGSLWISDYAVWLVKNSDCAVVIELAEANNGEYLDLGYAAITHEKMEIWLKYREEESNTTQDSYANDI